MRGDESKNRGAAGPARSYLALMSKKKSDDIATRLAAIDWQAAGQSLDDLGYAHLDHVLTPEECRDVAGWYEDDARFRSTVVMARHGFGQGEYKYLTYPLPPLIATLRSEVYPPLAAVANRWAELLGEAPSFPGTLARFTARCHDAGQTRPTPLILRYAAGGYNRLHQDLYGDIAFPIQMAILLSRPV